MIRSHNLLLLTVLATVMLLGVAVVELPLASATKGSYPGTNGKVAFCAFTSYPKTAIFIMNEDGTDRQQLTSGDFFDDYPCWSPDGTKIVFARAVLGFADFAVWVMNADGTDLRQLTSSGYATSPAWSPDGSRIAFVREPGGYDIYEIDAVGPTGDGTKRITNGRNPSWSPDGSKIAFDDGYNIYLADTGTWSVGSALAVGTGPCWSPDSSKIVFERGPSIWVMNVAGSNQEQLTTPPLSFFDNDPNWSPDGTKIVFRRSEDSIWIMNANGSGALDLTPSMLDARSPDYQTLPSITVGGHIEEPTPKFEILASFLAFIGLAITASIVVLVRNRGKD